MIRKLFLDTHAVIWLAEGRIEKFTDNGIKELSRSSLLISPMVRLELQFLHQKLKFLEAPDVTIALLNDKLNLQVDDLNFNSIVGVSMQAGWTRDVFDLLITAHAAYYDYPLLTKDRIISAHYKKAMW